MDKIRPALRHLLPLPHGGLKYGRALWDAPAAHVGDELGLGLCAGGGVGDLLLVPQYVHALLAGVWELS